MKAIRALLLLILPVAVAAHPGGGLITDGTTKPFRGSGEIAKSDPPLQQVIAYHWAADETLYLSDGNHLRRVGKDGAVRLVARVEGKPV